MILNDQLWLPIQTNAHSQVGSNRNNSEVSFPAAQQEDKTRSPKMSFSLARIYLGLCRTIYGLLSRENIIVLFWLSVFIRS
jgi:hypothetical protein